MEDLLHIVSYPGLYIDFIRNIYVLLWKLNVVPKQWIMNPKTTRGMKQKQFHLGGNGYHIEIIKTLLRHGNGLTGDHYFLMLEPQQYVRKVLWTNLTLFFLWSTWCVMAEIYIWWTKWDVDWIPNLFDHSVTPTYASYGLKDSPVLAEWKESKFKHLLPYASAYLSGHCGNRTPDDTN